MFIEINLETIKKNAVLREDQNYRFRSFLKGQDSKQLDRLVHDLYKRVVDQIDCTQCANCCIELETSFKMDEIDRLAESSIIEKERFIAELTNPDADGEKDIVWLKNQPCHFLKDKKCTIYPLRPGECQRYPYLYKSQIIQRLYGVVSNYGICPIVYNVFELLKMKYMNRKF